MSKLKTVSTFKCDFCRITEESSVYILPRDWRAFAINVTHWDMDEGWITNESPSKDACLVCWQGGVSIVQTRTIK